MATVMVLDGVVFNNSLLPAIDLALVVPYKPQFESGAKSHYVLGLSHGSSYVNNAGPGFDLVPGGVVAEVSENSLIVAPSAALDTGVAIGSSVTVCAVFKTCPDVNGAGNMPIAVFGASAGKDRVDREGAVIDGGIALYTQSNGAGVSLYGNANYRPSGAKSGGSTQAIPVNPDEYIFAAYSVSSDHSEFYHPNSVNSVEFSSFPVGDPGITTGHTLHVGNRYYHGSLLSVAEVAEVVIFDGVKTQSELSEIYQRSKVRMVQRGIVI